MKGFVTISQVFIFLLLISISLISNAENKENREYELKAAYLFNLIKFINWPENSRLSLKDEINVCVYGINPFHGSLKSLEKHTLKGKPIRVIELHNDNNPTICHILFFSEKNNNIANELNKTENYSSITVGESESFISNGGMVSLVIINNSVKIIINHKKTKEHGFVVSANLLEIAHEVKQ